MSTLLQAVGLRLRGMGERKGRIDIKQLVRQLSDADLLRDADAYFAGLSVQSEQCYKPFSNVSDAIHITRNVSLLLQAADVFQGAEVVDFGCATGWLSLALADLGCSVIGVDIAPSALLLAKAWAAQRGVRAGGAVRFMAYDGHLLPLDDGSVDRVVCFDSFHHVKDQAATLKELARVLRPGGRVAMVEPGPFHSLTEQSQAEMSQFNVIENDIVMADIAAAALNAGLGLPQLLVQLQKPTVVPFAQYQEWAGADGLPKADGERLLAGLKRNLTDTQCFYLQKPGAGAAIDSRRPHALAADIRLQSAQAVVGHPCWYELKFRIHNTGEAVWLGKPGAVGQVNLGCQLLRPDNTVESLDFNRFAIGASDVLPGSVVEVTVRLQMPVNGRFVCRFDLVAEHVAWFAQGGRCKPTDWQPDN